MITIFPCDNSILWIAAFEDSFHLFVSFFIFFFFLCLFFSFLKFVFEIILCLLCLFSSCGKYIASISNRDKLQRFPPLPTLQTDVVSCGVGWGHLPGKPDHQTGWARQPTGKHQRGTPSAAEDQMTQATHTSFSCTAAIKARPCFIARTATSRHKSPKPSELQPTQTPTLINSRQPRSRPMEESTNNRLSYLTCPLDTVNIAANDGISSKRATKNEIPSTTKKKSPSALASGGGGSHQQHQLLRHSIQKLICQLQQTHPHLHLKPYSTAKCINLPLAIGRRHRAAIPRLRKPRNCAVVDVGSDKGAPLRLTIPPPCAANMGRFLRSGSPN